MLFSAEIIAEAAEFFRKRREIKLVVDPVMIATSGAALLAKDAHAALTEILLPLATIITPNTMEAEALTGMAVQEPEDLRKAARVLHDRFGCAALMKGGHLRTGQTACDLYYDGHTELLLTAPRARGVSTHGTGCTYSAAVAAGLAKGQPLAEALRSAKEFISRA